MCFCNTAESFLYNTEKPKFCQYRICIELYWKSVCIFMDHRIYIYDICLYHISYLLSYLTTSWTLKHLSLRTNACFVLRSSSFSWNVTNLLITSQIKSQMVRPSQGASGCRYTAHAWSRSMRDKITGHNAGMWLVNANNFGEGQNI